MWKRRSGPRHNVEGCKHLHMTCLVCDMMSIVMLHLLLAGL